MQRTLFILGLTLLTLSGCGQKGPLYLPDEAQELDSLQMDAATP